MLRKGSDGLPSDLHLVCDRTDCNRLIIQLKTFALVFNRFSILIKFSIRNCDLQIFQRCKMFSHAKIVFAVGKYSLAVFFGLRKCFHAEQWDYSIRRIANKPHSINIETAPLFHPNQFVK